MQANPANSQSRGRWKRWLIAALLFAGVVIAWGSDRQPADVTRPVDWYRSSTAGYEPPRTDVLRIASYNIHGGKGRDGQVDFRRIARDLQDIDLAALYEVRGHPLSSQANILGEVAGLNAAFLATERRWWHDHIGNAVLTKLPVEIVTRIPLVNTRGKAFRQVVLIDVPLQDTTVHLLATHIDSQQDREPQLKVVIQLFNALASPAILMGDLNSGPTDPQLVELLLQPDVDSVLDADAGQHIDWIITRGLKCIAAELVDSRASDHPVVKATLELP